MTEAALDQFSDRPVKCRFRSAAEMWTSRRSRASNSGNRERSACRRIHPRAKSSAIESVVIRNGILFRCRVHRGTSIGGLPRASPSDRATWGWGTTWGGGIKGWGKVTRSGLLGTPDLVLSKIERDFAPPAIWAARREVVSACPLRSVRHVPLEILKPGRRTRIRWRAPVAARRQRAAGRYFRPVRHG